MIRPSSIIRFKHHRIPAILAIAGLHLAVRLYSAPCCSVNAAAPSVISGDDSAQLTFSAGQSQIIGDVPAVGLPVFRDDNNREITQTLRLDGAILLSDRWQVGASVPLVRHELTTPDLNNAITSLGDIRFTAAYEILPEWSYSAWVPKGLLFTQLILPTGQSIYEADVPGLVDATGQGFYTLAVGALFLKTWSVWDAFAIPEIHYSLGRTFNNSQLGDTIAVGPGWGGSLALGLGLSPWHGNFRIGLRVEPEYGSAKTVTSSSGATLQSNQLAWDTGLEASYLVSEDWSISASYTDQTLLGPAINTALSRTLAISVQHRWQR